MRRLTLGLDLGSRHTRTRNARHRRTTVKLRCLIKSFVDLFEFSLDFDAFVSGVDSCVEDVGGGFDDLFERIGLGEHPPGQPVKTGAGRPRGGAFESEVSGDLAVARGDLGQGLADGRQMPVGILQGARAPGLHLVQPVGVRRAHHLPPHCEKTSTRLRACA